MVLYFVYEHKRKGVFCMQQASFSKSATLFAMPSFISGFARAADLGGTFDVYNGHMTAGEADWFAIGSDWEQVGADIQAAMRCYEDG
jgi:hypothetical protein